MRATTEWTLMNNPPGGQSDTDVLIGFDLGSAMSVAQYYKDSTFLGDYFAENTITIPPGDARTVMVDGVT